MFLGIDGGGTGCRARLVDAAGIVLGEGEAGAANLTLGIEVAAAAVRLAADRAFASAGLGEEDRRCTSLGLGLAAANVPELAAGFARIAWQFRHVVLASDAVTACLGAHAGEDGAILILGTGSHGLSLVSGRATPIGGWGFLLGDDASGAALGRALLRWAVAAVDGLSERSPLTDSALVAFNGEPAKAVAWARTAAPRDYARHARDIVEHAAAGDPVAVALMKRAAEDVERMIGRLVALGAPRVALAGGLAGPYRRWLSAASETVLVEPKSDALDGAIRLARGEGAR